MVGEPRIEFDEQPWNELHRLWRADPRLAARIDRELDGIPASRSGRRRSIRREAGGPLWGFVVADAEHAVLVLWEFDDGVPVVRYIGPDV